jgi:hypothetical protein
MAKKSQLKYPFPVAALARQILPKKFSVRIIRLISRHIARSHYDSLSEKAYKISEILANELQISIDNAKLSSTFGRKISWSQNMIREHLY